MLIGGAQESASLKVFGSVSCTREDFKNVCLSQNNNFIAEFNNKVSYLPYENIINFVLGYQWWIFIFYDAATI